MSRNIILVEYSDSYVFFDMPFNFNHHSATQAILMVGEVYQSPYKGWLNGDELVFQLPNSLPAYDPTRIPHHLTPIYVKSKANSL